jgi:methanogenic corrinoid protein MtbC1
LDLLLQHRAVDARRALLDASDRGVALVDIYQHVLTPAMYEVGRLWQTRQINEAEEHYCSHVTQTTLAILTSEVNTPRIRRAVVGLCIGQERHEVGIRMVTDCFALHGWDAVCLGSNVPGRNIESILGTWNPDVVALSATMTYHLAELNEVIRAIKNTRGKSPYVVVGGRPFNLCPGLAERMGANASAASCSELVTCTAKAFEA